MTNTPAGQALKPCPFCGGNDIEYSSLRLCFVCEVCNAEGPISEGYNHDAKNKWNTRHTADTASSEDIGESLRLYGYLPGNYSNKCWNCDAMFEGAKGSRQCIECAELAKCQHGILQAAENEAALTRPATAQVDERPENWVSGELYESTKDDMRIMREVLEATNKDQAEKINMLEMALKQAQIIMSAPLAEQPDIGAMLEKLHDNDVVHFCRTLSDQYAVNITNKITGQIKANGEGKTPAEAIAQAMKGQTK